MVKVVVAYISKAFSLSLLSRVPKKKKKKTYKWVGLVGRETLEASPRKFIIPSCHRSNKIAHTHRMLKKQVRCKKAQKRSTQETSTENKAKKKRKSRNVPFSDIFVPELPPFYARKFHDHNHNWNSFRLLLRWSIARSAFPVFLEACFLRTSTRITIIIIIVIVGPITIVVQIPLAASSSYGGGFEFLAV